MKSGLRLLGLLATADDSIQLQLTSKTKKRGACFCYKQEAKTQARLFQSCMQTPAIRTFLTNFLFSDVYEGLPCYSVLSKTSEVPLWLC